MTGEKIIKTICEYIDEEKDNELTLFVHDHPNYAQIFIEHNILQVELLMNQIGRISLELGFNLSMEKKK